jgi:ABC-type spermidine/putrescine transport system permease subunit II
LIIFSSSIILLFLVIPLFRVLIWSLFGEGGTTTITSTFTFKWYTSVIHSSHWMRALRISLLYAIFSTIIAFILTLIYFYYSLLYKSIFRIIGNTLIIIPLFFPILIYAISLKILGTKYFVPEFPLVTIGHICLIIPIQYFILQSSEENISKDWIFGSIIMGASHYEIIKKVIIPNILPAVFISIACGFLFSFDELVISNFVIDSANVTIPKKIWSDITRDINPEAGVIYIILFIINALITVLVYILMKMKLSINMKNWDIISNTMFFREWKTTISLSITACVIAIFIEFGLTGEVHPAPAIIAFIFVAVFFEVAKQLYMINIWGFSIFDKVYVYRTSKHEKVKNLAVKLLGIEMDSALQTSNDWFANANGFVINQEKNQKIYEILFSTNKREYYFGTDSNVPSIFSSLYPNYLTQSQNWKTGARILLCSFDDLVRDLANNKNDFESFYNWHITNNASLLFHKNTSANQKMNAFSLINTDLGVFDDNYVIIFKPIQNRAIQYWIKSHENFQETVRYLRFYLALIESPETKVIKYNDGELQLQELSKSKREEIINKLKYLWKIP